jgi:hypothetical protein
MTLGEASDHAKGSYCFGYRVKICEMGPHRRAQESERQPQKRFGFGDALFSDQVLQPCTSRGTQPNSIITAMSWLPNPKHWFERANETRLIASGIVDPVVRTIICKMADEYDRLAALAITRLENQEETERRQQEHAAMRKAARFATSLR